MGKKILLLVAILLGCVGGYGFVFGGNLIFNPDIQFVGATSENIYLDDTTLNSTTLVYQSNINLSEYHIVSSCDIQSEFLESYKSLYFFRIDYKNDTKCKNGNIVLQVGDDKIISTLKKLELKNKDSQVAIFIDYSPSDLQKFKESVEEEEKKYAIYKNYKGESLSKYYKFLKGQRKYKESVYILNTISSIQEARIKKYSSPVPGKTVSQATSKVPNSARPYREGYTDGIHHGWDIDGDYGNQVAALDDGIIVRIVDNFDESDFSRVVYGENLSEDQKLKNLDILRGKQVWLKTMKGEVIFYSHLNTIPSYIEAGLHVKRGENLGTIGVTGVPQDGYDDFHLHFSIMKNPYIFEKAGTYDLGEYMSWDWLTKGMSYVEVIEAQKNIFE